ncbi:MAG: ribosome-associated translation inhibitor RaiA [Clostridiaceae bacterium]|nr:ribosome-associated translation inhibitor RaiA [Clostridiaceae bacterium]
MNINVVGKGTKVTNRFRERVEKKLAKFERYFGDKADFQVKVVPEGNSICVELTLRVNGTLHRAETLAADPMTAFDEALDIVERQIRRYKTRIERHNHSYSYLRDYLREQQAEQDAEALDDTAKEDDSSIVKRKTFTLTPMTPDEATLQMEMLNHSFHVFLNSDTNLVSVVYKRHDGDYGLLEPEY